MYQKKGQAVFEFVIAAVLFFGIIFYVISFLNINMTTYSYQSRKSELESRAAGISEYLLYFNLTDEWPILSYQKIKEFQEFCNSPINNMYNYNKLLRDFDMFTSRMPGTTNIYQGRVKILLIENGAKLIDCDESVDMPTSDNTVIERYALSENNTIMQLRVIAW